MDRTLRELKSLAEFNSSINLHQLKDCTHKMKKNLVSIVLPVDADRSTRLEKKHSLTHFSLLFGSKAILWAKV